MVYASQALLSYSTAVRRDEAQAFISNDHGSKQKWGPVTNQAITDEAGNPAVSVEIRFTSKADSVDLMNKVIAQATGARLPLPGSWMTIHDCSHDPAQADVPCVIETRHTW